MPTRDADKRREQTRRAVAKHRAKACKPRAVSPADVSPGKQSPVVAWTGKQTMVGGELVPVRCWHCGAYHASVQQARDCTMETVLGEMCGRFAGVRTDGVWLQV